MSARWGRQAGQGRADFCLITPLSRETFNSWTGASGPCAGAAALIRPVRTMPSTGSYAMGAAQLAGHVLAAGRSFEGFGRPDYTARLMQRGFFDWRDITPCTASVDLHRTSARSPPQYSLGPRDGFIQAFRAGVAQWESGSLELASKVRFLPPAPLSHSCSQFFSEAACRPARPRKGHRFTVDKIPRGGDPGPYPQQRLAVTARSRRNS